MGLATIIALLAFFIALVALWLTSDIVKKVESQNEKFLRAHVTSLREELREIDKSLNKTTRMAKSQDENQKEMDKRLNDHTKALDDLQTRFASVYEHLEELDRSIPQRYRVRVVKSEKKSDEKLSIQ